MRPFDMDNVTWAAARSANSGSIRCSPPSTRRFFCEFAILDSIGVKPAEAGIVVEGVLVDNSIITVRALAVAISVIINVSEIVDVLGNVSVS